MLYQKETQFCWTVRVLSILFALCWLLVVVRPAGEATGVEPQPATSTSAQWRGAQNGKHDERRTNQLPATSLLLRFNLQPTQKRSDGKVSHG